MKVIVHRGGEQIGASCLEISSASTRIILDCGWPIEEQTTELLPPAVPGLFTAGTPPNAVLLSQTFDAIAESRKWREATSRKLDAMSLEERLAHLQKVRDHYAAAQKSRQPAKAR